ncbi:negative elongation factor E [Planococcus citri]|uniref:negative elongation factor E n=1 Tax=Planococcus citri TaxID=170843 RepID=UPI0031F8C094
MVYLHFPSNLTEEEMMLQAKYQKLKRKKKAAINKKTPRPEPERSPVKVSKGPKMEARDAREVAKKLLKSGAISPIVKASKRSESEGFKRPSRFRSMDKKLTEEKTVAGYQPFASSPIEDREEGKTAFSPKVKGLYDSFVSEKTLESKNDTERPESSKIDKQPKQGNTIFVSGYKINEEFLRKTFAQFGNIISVTMESEKNRGFVTFKKPDSSDKAIADMDGRTISGNTLKVSIAKRQLMNSSSSSASPIATASSNETSRPVGWVDIAEKYSQKGNYVDKREAIEYEEDLFSS